MPARNPADALIATGLPKTQQDGAIVLGNRDEQTLARARAFVPASVPVTIVGQGTFEATAFAVMRWCVALRVDPSRVAWWIDPEAAVDETRAAAVHDALWDHGASLLDRLGDRIGAFLGPLRAWADHAAARDRHHVALPTYLAIDRAHPTPELATRIAIAWARLGCPGRACEWLDRSDIPAPTRSSAHADFVAEADETRTAGAQVLARNLATLRRTWPAAADAIASADADDLEIWWCADVPWRLRSGTVGNFAVDRGDYPQLVRRDEGGRWRAVRPPACPLTARTQLDPRRPLRDLHACIGSVVDHAALANVLAHRMGSKVPNWRQQVCAVETDAAALRKLAQSMELGELLSPARIDRLEVGPDAEQRLVAGFAARPRQLLPRVRLGTSAALEAAFDHLAYARIAERDATIAALARTYDVDFPARVQAKRAAGRPLRVWLWTSIHTTVLQHVARGLAAGLEAAGHEVCLLVEATPQEALGPADVAGSLAAFEPDVAVLLDHTRHEYGPLFPANLPVVAWILDELPALVDPRVLARLTDRDLAFAWSEPLARTYRERGYPHCDALPFAVDPALYFADASVPRENVVAYATHLSFPDDLPYARGLPRALERHMMAMAEVPSGIEPLRPLLDATLAELGLCPTPEQLPDLAYQCLIVSRHVDRVKIADRVLAAGLPLALYGSGWSTIERFAPHHRGALAPGPELRRMYQSHAVVLHINTRCNLHPRVLEAAACRGFVLARSDGDFDFAPGGVDGCLAVGRELCLFADADDMIAKIRRAMADEAWRSGFATAGHDRVHAEHTYRARAEQIVAAIDGMRWTEGIGLGQPAATEPGVSASGTGR